MANQSGLLWFYQYRPLDRICVSLFAVRIRTLVLEPSPLSPTLTLNLFSRATRAEIRISSQLHLVRVRTLHHPPLSFSKITYTSYFLIAFDEVLLAICVRSRIRTCTTQRLSCSPASTFWAIRNQSELSSSTPVATAGTLT